jgi:hypothetical protein
MFLHQALWLLYRTGQLYCPLIDYFGGRRSVFRRLNQLVEPTAALCGVTKQV